MDYVKRYKWAITAFIIMVILNVGTLISLWVLRPPGFMPDEHQHSRMIQKFMARELNLSDQQVKEFRKLRIQHMEKTQKLAGELRRNRMLYFEVLSNQETSADSVKADSISALVARNYIALERSVFMHFAELKSNLNKDQKQKFEQLTKESLFRNYRNKE